MSETAKVAIIGLDCVPPELVFEKWGEELPTFKRLREEGWWGPLRSITPPITVPAWSCMMSSRDPGELGIYGFRNRKDYSYDGLIFAYSDAVRHPRVWELLSQAGKQVVVLGVPGTFPPKAVRGSLVSCFLTPSADADFTYPPDLKPELAMRFGPYILDVENFRSEEKQATLDQIYRMTEQRFGMARYLAKTRPWDFFMMVEMGTDRIHHAFWKYFDETHPKYEKGNPFENAMFEYYQFLDQQIAGLLPLLGEETAVFVVSDHGAQKMEGGVCVNEWLQREGYLRLAETPRGVTRISKVKIDWTKTRVWGEGGYYSRIFLNVEGREPQGIVPRSEYEALRDELKRKLEAMTDHEGRPLGTKVFRPEEIYRSVEAVAPDLIVLFGDLRWRSVGSVGLDSIYTFENDTGPDDANHAMNGIFMLREPASGSQARGRGGKIEGLSLFDIAPTVLARFGMEPLPGMQGKVIQP